MKCINLSSQGTLKPSKMDPWLKGGGILPGGDKFFSTATLVSPQPRMQKFLYPNPPSVPLGPLPPPPPLALHHLHRLSLNFCGGCPSYHDHMPPIAGPTHRALGSLSARHPSIPLGPTSPPPPPFVLCHLHRNSLNFCGGCPGYHGHTWPSTCPRSWRRVPPPSLPAFPLPPSLCSLCPPSSPPSAPCPWRRACPLPYWPLPCCLPFSLPPISPPFVPVVGHGHGHLACLSPSLYLLPIPG